MPKKFRKQMSKSEPASHQVLGESAIPFAGDGSPKSSSRQMLARQVQRRLYLSALVLSDVLALGLAFGLAYFLRFSLDLEIFEVTMLRPEVYLVLAAAISPLWILLFYLLRLYDLHYLLGGTQEYSHVFNACTLGMMVLISFTFFAKIIVARGWIVLFWLLTVLCVGVFRFAMRRIAYAFRRRGYLQIVTLIVGADTEARAIAKQLETTPTCGAAIIGFLDDQPHEQKIDGLPILGSISAVQQIVARYGVEEVLLSTPALSREQIIAIHQAFAESNDVEIRLSSGLYEILTTGARIKEWSSIPLISLNKVRLSDIETWVKTLIDYSLSMLVLLMFLPLFALIAFLIKFDSPGPFLYRRRVLGRGGREFNALKFRTMYMDGDKILARYPSLRAELQANHKLKQDPRVTRMGRWLRRYSLDEVPQLFNVLSGRMSLVGPRMISPAEVEMYGRWRMNLLTVKPGLTGLWQIGGRSALSYEERIRIDMQYIRNYSIWLDFLILFQTIPVVLRGQGAY
jgi:exopolysaccharide biosynthesis polyprenyl glycosylphosphotransferase